MKISKTQLRQIIKEELSVLSENEQPEIEQLLAAAIEAISEHQTSMPEPDDLLAYALEQLTAVQGLLRGGEESAPAHDELNKAMAAIESAYKNEATRETLPHSSPGRELAE